MRLLCAFRRLPALLVLASQAPLSAQSLFLLIDEDGINKESAPNFLSASDVNEDVAGLGLRAQLRFFRDNVGRRITLNTGQVGDEGWFALQAIPPSWGPSGGLAGYIGDPAALPRDPLPHGVGRGLGGGPDPEALLDKVPDVTPLRVTALDDLRGATVCGLVYKGDISINYNPLNGSLKGATLGLVAFRVSDAFFASGGSSSTLPQMEVTILDASRVCTSQLALYTRAPRPLASSEPVSIRENGVVNAASLAAAGDPGHPSAPGSLVSVFGANFTSETTGARFLPLPSSLGGVSVTIQGIPARLLFVSPQQINVQFPWSVPVSGGGSDTASIVVTRDGVSSPARQIRLNRFSPGIFTFASGSGPAVVINSNGTLAQPGGLIPSVASEPARVGGTIVVLATGLGPVDSAVEDGRNSLDRLRRTTTVPVLLIGGREARVDFAGLSPEFAGVYQINAEVPAGAATGDAVPIQLRVGGITTTERVTIAVRL